MTENYLTAAEVAAMLRLPYYKKGHGGDNRRVWQLMEKMGGFKLGNQWRIAEAKVHEHMAKLAALKHPADEILQAKG